MEDKKNKSLAYHMGQALAMCVVICLMVGIIALTVSFLKFIF